MCPTKQKHEKVAQNRYLLPSHVGNLLKAIDDLGIANNTIVIYGTDNGVHMNSWPDGGMTPFRSEKNTNWEGAYRVPAMIRWPGRIRPGAHPE